VDLRERVIEAVEEGASRDEAAERFAVSVSSAVKWLQAWRKEGRRGPKPRGGRRSPLEEHAQEILALVGEWPDWTLEELVVALHKRRMPGSRSALWRFLERHRISFKKRMARPVCKRHVQSDLISLRQRIRSRGTAPAKMEIRAPRSS
jgi:transposase